MWTVETKNANVLDFTPDGQSLWAYGSDESKDRSVITFQRYELATGKVLAEPNTRWFLILPIKGTSLT